MITAENITDEQIRDELRTPASEEGIGIDTTDEHVGVPEILNLCDEALGDFEYGARITESMSDDWFAMRKREARARCAELLNARAKESR